MSNQNPLFSNFPTLPKRSALDSLLSEFDKALKTLTGAPMAQRQNPSSLSPIQDNLSETEKKQVIDLMRVNHVGEICAQALYQAQALASQDLKKKALFIQAAQEEVDHLAWVQERLEQLNARPSLLNPLWYCGAFALGFMAGTMGDKISLGFMAETEKQVEKHLNRHLERLPVHDQKSRAILEQMRQDEIEHGQAALDQGAEQLPLAVRFAMTAMSKVMTTLAQKI